MADEKNTYRSPIDWEAARRQISKAEAWIADESARTPDEEQELLECRARALARVPEAGRGERSVVEVVVFSMAHERYGLEAALVREVYPLRELTPLPGVPDFVLGIVNVRGRVISLIDLKKFFSLPDRGLAETNYLIILSSADMEFGILADSIYGVQDIFESDLQRELPTLTGLRSDYLRGVSSDGVVVLDAMRILKDPAIVVRDDGMG